MRDLQESPAHRVGGEPGLLEGWEPVSSEVTFVDMGLEGGRYRPLLGYTVLEQAGVAADPVGGRLLKIPHLDLRAASGSAG